MQNFVLLLLALKLHVVKEWSYDFYSFCFDKLIKVPCTPSRGGAGDVLAAALGDGGAGAGRAGRRAAAAAGGAVPPASQQRREPLIYGTYLWRCDELLLLLVLILLQ